MRDKKILVLLLISGLLAAVTAALSLLRIPLPGTPVPITGQSLGPMLSGIILGRKYGALSQIVYLLLGAVGLPVFAGGRGGPGVLFGPSGGYLWGFVLGAWVTGYLFEKLQPTSFMGAFCCTVIGGILVVYCLGIIQLCIVAKLSLKAALLAGALPFIPGDLFKAAVAAVSASRIVGVTKRLT
ncbi:MAG: biotin transporter BioY [Bacillota bacterium]